MSRIVLTRFLSTVLVSLVLCFLASCGDKDSVPIASKGQPSDREKTSSAEPILSTGANGPTDDDRTGDGKPNVKVASRTQPLGDEWRAVGPGGGGKQEFPAISPHDPSLMFVACDMSGFYRSEDAGQNWRMLDQVRRITHPPVFHPTDPNVVYVCARHFNYVGMNVISGWGFYVSTDRGQSWSRVFTHDYKGYSRNEVSALVLDPDEPKRMWLAFRDSGDVMTSRDGGESWVNIDQETGKKLTRGIERFVLGISGQRILFAHSGDNVYKSADEGVSWEEISPGNGTVIDLIGATTNDDVEQTTLLYALGTPSDTGTETTNAIFRSKDDGATWEDLSPQFVAGVDPGGRIVRMRRIETSLADPNTAYVSAELRDVKGRWHYGMLKSIDAGDTWSFLFPRYEMHEEFRLQRHLAQFDDFEPGWVPLEFNWFLAGSAINMAVSPSDPDQLLWTDMGRTMGTQDGGKTWKGLYCNRGKPRYYNSRGLDVTGGFRVVFDPHHENRMWIASNDIGNWRSDDGGVNWRYAMRGAKHRLCMYELRVDPDIPDRLYGASSGVHDMPRWRYIAQDPATFKGGFVISDDGGLTWTTQGEGLPEAACVGLVLDPTSDQDNRTLYISVYGHGVYKSVDSGKTWQRKVNGMESYIDLNANFFSMARSSDGTLYASITNRVRFVPGKGNDSRGGALFISKDGAESWRRIGPQTPEEPSRTKNEFSFIWDVVTSPHNPDEVIVACSVDPHSRTSAPGGIYRSRDCGATWQRIFGHARCCRADFHPTDPDVLFCGTGSGLHWSSDAGDNWHPVEGIPFKEEVNRANVDPSDPNRIWVTTWGGGVWTGLFRK